MVNSLSNFRLDENTGTSTSTDYRSILSRLVESLKPGGEIEKSYVNDAVEEGKLLGAQLNAAAVSKGLGNVTSNTPVTVAKHVARRKQEIRGNLLQQLLSTMQFLANLSFQESEAQKSRELNAAQFNVSHAQSSPPNTDAFGDPFWFKTGINDLNFGNSGFSAQQYPSLAAAGGMGDSTTIVGGGPSSLFGNTKSDDSYVPNYKVDERGAMTPIFPKPYKNSTSYFDDIIWSGGGSEDISDLAVDEGTLWA